MPELLNRCKVYTRDGSTYRCFVDGSVMIHDPLQVVRTQRRRSGSDRKGHVLLRRWVIKLYNENIGVHLCGTSNLVVPETISVGLQTHPTDPMSKTMVHTFYEERGDVDMPSR